MKSDAMRRPRQERIGALDVLVTGGDDGRGGGDGPMVALYSAGPGEPAKRPAVLTDSEKRSRARARKRALTSDASLASQLARL